MNVFVIAGAIFAVWAVLVSLLGMRGFPKNQGAERAVIVITAVLFAGAVGSAIADQTKVGERHGPHKEESAHEKEPVEGAAPSEPGQQGAAQEAPSEQPSGGGPTELALAADATQLKFDKGALDAPTGQVTIVMTNPGAVPHDVSLRGDGVDQKGDQVTDGGKSTVQADVKPGSYEFYCSVPGHEAAGMKGTLTVK
jgi:plastocyanin